MKNRKLILSFTMILTACVPATGARIKIDTKRVQSGGTEISRSTDPDDCSKVSPHAQNIFLQWGRNRINEGTPVAVGTVSALMGLARFESGGGKGANFANVTSHGNEDNTNRQGDNGLTFGNTNAVESFLDRHRTSHETNFGALQISPNVIVNYHLENAFMSYVNHFDSPSSLYSSCLTDMAYQDKANALRNITELYEKRDQLSGWFKTLSNYTAKSQSACRASTACVTASAEVGRWLSYCPRINMDAGAVVYHRAPGYFGARKNYPGLNPQVCREMIAAELGRSKTNPQIAEESKPTNRSPASHHGSGNAQAI